MELTAFNARLGTSQGRLSASSASKDGAEFVFVLGDEEPGRRYDLVVGDQVEVQQRLDLNGVDFIRVQMRLSVPNSTPDELCWEAAVTVDEVVMAASSCGPGQTRMLNDLAANVSKMSGVALVGVRLMLKEV